MVPGAIGMLLLGPASGALGNRVGNKVPLVLGAAIAAVGLVLIAFIHDSVWALVGFSGMLYAGVGLFALPLAARDACEVVAVEHSTLAMEDARVSAERAGLHVRLRASDVESALGGIAPRPGERIVLDGRQNLRPGSAVVVRDGGGAPGRAARGASGPASGAVAARPSP